MTISREPIHVCVTGDSGSGKTTFATTFNKPAKVLQFDPRGKDIPYLKKGTRRIKSKDGHGVHIYGKKEQLLFDITYYHNKSTEHPDAYKRFMLDMHTMNWADYKTVIIDSATYMELAARMYCQYILDKNSREPRKWFAQSTQFLEEQLLVRFSALENINVVIVTHVDEERDEVNGTFLRVPKMPGRLRRTISSGYSELYRAFVAAGENGTRQYLLQTQADNIWNCASQIDAPNPCMPHYKMLWANYKSDIPVLEEA